MAVAMVPILVVILIIRVARGVVTWMSVVMMAMIMGMKARGGHILARMPMQPGRRRPGELERNDEHDDQGDEATHGVHSTELTVSTKGSFIPWALFENTRISRRTDARGADGCKSGCSPLKNGRW